MIFVIVAIGSAWNYAQEIGVQLLSDPGFEQSLPNGSFPTSGAWAPSWLYQAGQLCTNNAVHSGGVGLYIYTGNDGTSWRSDPYQATDKTAAPGDVFTGEVWARSLSSWVTDSRMLVRLTFLDSSHLPIVSKDSSALVTASSAWTKLTVITDPAPTGTTYIRYRLYLDKPSGVIGQSIGNFDDCYLELTSQNPPVPLLNIYPQALGITKDQTETQFTIKNIGNSLLHWNLSESESWITGISSFGGTIAPGGNTLITVTVNRTGLTGDNYKGFINLTSDGGDETVSVYMDMANGYCVPPAPSLVTTDGYRVLLQKRLPNGLLDTVKPFVIKGVAWSPSSLGSTGNVDERRSDFHNWFTADIQLIKEMNANVVYTFLDFGSGAQAVDILDNLYKNGIMAIVTVDEDGSNNTSKITEIVNSYKHHPAILMWAIGNEWNINYYHDKFGSHLTPATAKLQASAEATELAAQQIKGLDTLHPIASIHGEIDITNRQPLTPAAGYLSTQEIVNNVCPSVDLWGANIYRGDNFGTLFSQWASISDKPLFLSEFGTDSYYTTGWYDPIVGYESEADQATWIDSLWTDIEPEISAYDVQKVCPGGTVFEWSDEWWKIPTPGGSPNEHDNEGFETYWNRFAHPDGFANEEYFGMVHIGRKIKPAYTSLQTHFDEVSNFAPTAIPSSVIAEQGVPLSITLKGSDVEGSVLTYEIVDSPVNGNLGTISGNTVTFTAFPGYTGVDSFTFRCFDGIKYSTPAAVSINVVMLPIITITSPNGGESFPTGSRQEITWTSAVTEADVKIDYSIDNGASWTCIIPATNMKHHFYWTVPNTPANNCLIRVSEVNQDVSLSDVSDAVFSIFSIPYITVTLPNGGEKWPAGSTQHITWSSSGIGSDVKIEFSIDTGTSWSTIVQNTSNDGSYDWLVPANLSKDCLIRISDIDGTPTDVSDAVFSIISSISPTLTITSPNGGENFTIGSPQVITWTGTEMEKIKHVKIEYSINNGTSWKRIVAFTENDGSCNWLIPDDPANNCLVRIRKSDSDQGPLDVSDAVFSIVTADTINIIAPNGGEQWKADSSYNITWRSTGISGDIVLDLYRGTTFDYNIGIVPVESGSYRWHIPENSILADDYKIFIHQDTTEDYSDAVFSIVERAPNNPDFNNDGKIDILWRNYTTGSNEVWYMNGAVLTGSTPIPAQPDLNWRIVGTGDFNRDGKVDILWRNYANCQNQIWYMDGVALINVVTFPEQKDNPSWQISGTGDFNGDGKVDILWRNLLEGRNKLWYLDGDVIIGNTGIQALDNKSMRMAGTGDFNSDGKVDILWRNYSTGSNEVWYMNGAVRTGSALLLELTDLSWQIAAVGDFNGDGKPDILWRRYTDGANMIWYMDGITRMGTENITARSDLNWRIVGNGDYKN